MSPEKTKVFKFTQRQKEAQKLAAGDATHILLYGGSRSGKTFLHVRNMCLRAIKAAKSRHVILRFRFNHCKQSIVYDTFPKVMDTCFPKVSYRLDKSDWFAEFKNGAQIWFGGLDDKDRTEKILGNEYATIYLNECSQISNLSREIVKTRLAQVCTQVLDGKESPLPLRMYYDCNPPRKGHWTHKLFIELVEPESKQPLANKRDYVYMRINPDDNAENLSSRYLEELKTLSPRMRKRFYLGEFADDNPNQLFSEGTVDACRVLDGELPEMVRIIVGVDPSGASDDENENNDDIGIVCGGLGTDGRAYLLEDCTIKAGPATWGKVATGLYDRRRADRIVAEKNFGGEMVRFVIQSASPNVAFSFVTATRGKTVRAEPIAALYEQDKVRHAGYFHALEDELLGFSTFGYIGNKSPNRADAWVWVVTELFSGIVAPKKEPVSAASWYPTSTEWS